LRPRLTSQQSIGLGIAPTAFCKKRSSPGERVVGRHERATNEVHARRVEALAAHRRERDLISVVHHQMLTTQSMSDELDRKRRRRWRRRPRMG